VSGEEYRVLKKEKNMESLSLKKTLNTDELGYKGSQLRCLLLTSMEKTQLQDSIVRIIKQKAHPELSIVFSDDFEYYPKGFANPKEAELDKVNIPVNGSFKYCETLNRWWLKRNARTPVWDFVCNATINDTSGLVLVEAKAHQNELCQKQDQSGAKEGSLNRQTIDEALSLINRKYNYKLSADNHYQLSNRVAWCLKLASLGIPVVLIYLGCLHTNEMTISKTDSLLYNAEQWESLVTKYSGQIGFKDWEKKISGKPLQKDSEKSSFFYPIIRTIDIQLQHGEIDLLCNII